MTKSCINTICIKCLFSVVIKIILNFRLHLTHFHPNQLFLQTQERESVCARACDSTKQNKRSMTFPKTRELQTLKALKAFQVTRFKFRHWKQKDWQIQELSRKEETVQYKKNLYKENRWKRERKGRSQCLDSDTGLPHWGETFTYAYRKNIIVC